MSIMQVHWIADVTDTIFYFRDNRDLIARNGSGEKKSDMTCSELKAIVSRRAQIPFVFACVFVKCDICRHFEHFFLFLFFHVVNKISNFNFDRVLSVGLWAYLHCCWQLLAVVAIHRWRIQADFTGNFISTNTTKENKQSINDKSKELFWAVAAGNYSFKTQLLPFEHI